MRKLLLLGVAVGCAASFPLIYQPNSNAFEQFLRLAFSTRQSAEEPPPDAAMVTTSVPAAPQQLGRRMTVQADDRGHFSASFKFNGRPVDAMIDTGATLVAMNASTARKIGISMQPSDFNREVNTANGTARAAVVEIARLEVGRIALQNVQAMVLEDSSLRTTLVGMSFLKRLNKYQVENGNMLLEQ